MLPVDLGDRVIDVPVADITGNRPGRTLLVTAGMDGDEYAGMEAAYRLISDFASGDFAGRLIVVPIVNVPGFYQECSQNPLDGKLPKMCGLGRRNGSSTDRLVHWLSSYAVVDCWYDMHGGAITEGLEPFLWLYRTKAASDALSERILNSRLAETVVNEQVTMFSKAGQLAGRGCCYVLAESGARGRRDEADIERHLTWVQAVMSLLEMTTGEIEPVSESKILNCVTYYFAPFNGIWRPAKIVGEAVKGAELGSCSSLTGGDVRAINFKENGTCLWWKETMAMRKGDVLCAVGYE